MGGWRVTTAAMYVIGEACAKAVLACFVQCLLRQLQQPSITREKQEGKGSMAFEGNLDDAKGKTCQAALSI